MVVLDVGCGAGNVAMIAAALVRPGGCVVAVDVDPRVLKRARPQADQAGHRNIDFVHGDARDLAGDRTFDAVAGAVVGRLVLLHQTDPKAALAATCRRLRSGGVVAFCDLDSRYVVHTHPPVELYTRARGWICETLKRAGFDTLAERLRDEVTSHNGAVSLPALVGVWTIKQQAEPQANWRDPAE